MAYDIIAARGYGSAEQGDATNPATVNHYAAVSAVDTSANSITVSDATNFTAGTEILMHISAAKTASANATYLGRYKFAKVMQVAGNVLTLSTRPLNVTVDNWFYQAITVPHYKTLTISTTIEPPAFNETSGVGGILVFKAQRLVMSGSINLVDKGLTSDAQRPLLNQESGGTLDADTYSGYENYDASYHFTLQKGDGSALIIAKRIDFESSARIGNPIMHGIARCRNASDSIGRSSYYSNVGGSSIVIVSPTINDFDPYIISKYRADNLTAGKGLARAYIATESRLPCDEGLYSYDIISKPERLYQATLINDFGGGSQSAKQPLLQQNSYAKVSKISNDGMTFTLTNIDSGGQAKFTVGALVMIHADFKKDTYLHAGRFFLSKVVGTSANSITLANSIDELGLGNFDLDHYNFQAIAIPTYSTFTLTGTNDKTPKWNGCGGIFAIAVSDTCNLSGGKISVVGKGGNRMSLNSVSNAQMKNRLPIGEGHGSVFILAKNLIVNSSTRLGALQSGNSFGGVCKSNQLSGGCLGKRSSAVVDKYSGYGGSDYQGGKQLHGHDGGFAGNASDYRANSGLQGASIFIVAQSIDGLTLDCLSTGGQGSSMTSNDSKALTNREGSAGGCGYGGAGSDFTIGTTSNYGACGGVHGGGSGSSNEDNSKWSGGGGASGFCTIYCNSFTSQDTTNLSFN